MSPEPRPPLSAVIRYRGDRLLCDATYKYICIYFSCGQFYSIVESLFIVGVLGRWVESEVFLEARNVFILLGASCHGIPDNGFSTWVKKTGGYSFSKAELITQVQACTAALGVG